MKTYKTIYETPHLAGVGFKGRWDKADVIHEYDSNWNITLSQLARRSGWTIAELKELLGP